MALPFPPELYSSIIEQFPPDSLQSILALTRALPYDPIPQHHLFERIIITRAEQALQLTLRLLKPDAGKVSQFVQEFSLLDQWTVDAEIMVDLLRKFPKLRSLSLCIGTNFAPEHLKAIFERFALVF